MLNTQADCLKCKQITLPLRKESELARQHKYPSVLLVTAFNWRLLFAFGYRGSLSTSSWWQETVASFLQHPKGFTSDNIQSGVGVTLNHLKPVVAPMAALDSTSPSLGTLCIHGVDMQLCPHHFWQEGEALHTHTLVRNWWTRLSALEKPCRERGKDKHDYKHIRNNRSHNNKNFSDVFFT